MAHPYGWRAGAGSCQGISVLHISLFMELLEHPHSMRACLLLSEWVKRARWKVQCFLWRSPSCHTPSFPLYSIGHTDQLWFNRRGDHTRKYISWSQDYWELSWRLTTTSGWKLRFYLIVDERCWKRKQNYQKKKKKEALLKHQKKQCNRLTLDIASWFLEILLKFPNKFHHLVSAWPWASHFLSPNFSFLFYKIGFILSVS